MEYGMFDAGEGVKVVSNPYAVAPAAGAIMKDAQRHEGGNALAANAEARVVAEVKAQVLMARQFPRDANFSAERILQECTRPTLAEAAVYTFPRGRETVTGPSIRLAEVLARNWGNNTYGMEVLERNTNDDGIGYSVVRTFAWDLETNTYISRQFELKHWRATKNGGYALKDDRDIYELEANMGSRRMRACILQMIPGDVTNAAVAKCRQTSSTGLGEAMKNPDERARLVIGTIKFYEKLGVSQADLEVYLSARSDDWTADHMLRLKELKNSLDDGISTIGDVFPHLAGGNRDDFISKDQVSELMAMAKETGVQGKISDALKQMGIAKFADIPSVQFDEIKALIGEFMPKAEVPKIDKTAPKTAAKTKGDEVVKADDKAAYKGGSEPLPWEGK